MWALYGDGFLNACGLYVAGTCSPHFTGESRSGVEQLSRSLQHSTESSQPLLASLPLFFLTLLKECWGAAVGCPALLPSHPTLALLMGRQNSRRQSLRSSEHCTGFLVTWGAGVTRKGPHSLGACSITVASTGIGPSDLRARAQLVGALDFARPFCRAEDSPGLPKAKPAHRAAKPLASPPPALHLTALLLLPWKPG